MLSPTTTTSAGWLFRSANAARHRTSAVALLRVVRVAAAEGAGVGDGTLRFADTRAALTVAFAGAGPGWATGMTRGGVLGTSTGPARGSATSGAGRCAVAPSPA